MVMGAEIVPEALLADIEILGVPVPPPNDKLLAPEMM
jgi:hypothetical protein